MTPGLEIARGVFHCDEECVRVGSDAIDPYLKAMGLCQIAIDGNHQKEAATDTYYTMEQSGSTLKQSKVSWSGPTSRELDFDKPHHESGNQIPKVFTASIVDNSVVVTTDMGEGRTLRDVRTLDEEGTSIKMDLELVTPKETIRLTRWLVKSTLPTPEAADDGGGDPIDEDD